MVQRLELDVCNGDRVIVEIEAASQGLAEVILGRVLTRLCSEVTLTHPPSAPELEVARLKDNLQEALVERDRLAEVREASPPRFEIAFVEDDDCPSNSPVHHKGNAPPARVMVPIPVAGGRRESSGGDP